jgi:hypothetical protein
MFYPGRGAFAGRSDCVPIGTKGNVMEDPRDTPRRRIAMIDGGLGGFGALAALAMMARPIAGEVRIAAEAALPVRKDPLHTAAPAPAELTRQQRRAGARRARKGR